jgi:hypothetical protein
MNAAGATAAIAATQAVTVIANPLEIFFNSLNTNPYFIGLMMLMLNLGGRFLGMEVSRGQEQFFQQTWIRRCFIFTVLFVATRNVLVALFMSVIMLLLIGYLFNENSDLYLGGKEETFETDEKKASAPGQTLTSEETEILRRLTDKQKRLSQSTTPDEKTPAIKAEDTYMHNLTFLQEIR